MNANELAKQLSQMDTLQDVMSKFEYSIIQKSEAMLRQLQAENEALKAKALTDEEIDLIAGMVPTIPTAWDLIEFARAILRKAQEK